MSTKTDSNKRQELVERFAARHAQYLPTLDLGTEQCRTEAREQLALSFRITHRDWPQYEGYPERHFAQLVRITRKVTTKLGVAFLPGDVTVAIVHDDDEAHRARYGLTGTTLYSWRNGIATSVQPSHFTEVAE